MQIPPAEKIDNQVQKIQSQAQEDELRAIVEKLENASYWPVTHEIKYDKTKKQLKQAGYKVGLKRDYFNNNYLAQTELLIQPDKPCCVIN